jgi:hypothetical protein
LQASTEDSRVVDSGLRLSDIQNIVALRGKPVNNSSVDVFVRDDLHVRT